MPSAENDGRPTHFGKLKTLVCATAETLIGHSAEYCSPKRTTWWGERGDFSLTYYGKIVKRSQICPLLSSTFSLFDNHPFVLTWWRAA